MLLHEVLVMPHEVLVRTVLVQLVLLPQGLVHGQLVLLPLVVAAAVGVTTALAAGLTMTSMMMMKRKRSYVEGDGPGLAGSRKQHCFGLDDVDGEAALPAVGFELQQNCA